MNASYLDKTFHRLMPVMTDDLVEVAINPDGRVWLERHGDAYMELTDLRYTPEEAMSVATELANEGEIRMSEKHPIGSASINYRDWLIRAQIIQPNAVRNACSIAMRFFRPGLALFQPSYFEGGPESSSERRKKLNETIAKLAKTDLLSALEKAVNERLNIVVSGGTSSGKTNVARWLVSKVSEDERIITIEDTPDLMPSQPNTVLLVSNRQSDVQSPDRLLQATLRMRPDRIILSEVTGSDAYTFLKAINTGHGGSITTVHAETAELAIERLAQTALEADVNMMYQDMISYVQRSIDIIIHVGKINGKRGVRELFLPQDFSQSVSNKIGEPA